MSDENLKCIISTIVLIFLGIMFYAILDRVASSDEHDKILEAIEELKQQKVEQIEKPNTIEKVTL